LRSRANLVSQTPPLSPNIPNFNAFWPYIPLNPVATQTDFTSKPLCRTGSVLRCQSVTA